MSVTLREFHIHPLQMERFFMPLAMCTDVRTFCSASSALSTRT